MIGSLTTKSHVYGSKTKIKPKWEKGEGCVKTSRDFPILPGDMIPFMKQNTTLWAHVFDEIST